MHLIGRDGVHFQQAHKRLHVCVAFRQLIRRFVSQPGTPDVVLTPEEMKDIDATLDSITIYGDSDESHIVDLRNMLKEEGYEIEKSWNKNK